MKKIYLLLSLLVALSAIGTRLAAQDPNFSQFYFKESYYNPAFIGINPGLRGVLTNRQFWSNVPGDHSTTHLAIDYYDVKLLNGGVSVFGTTYTKGEGWIRTSSAGLGYAKRIGITDDFIMQVGGSAQYTMNKYDFDALTFSDQFDPVHGPIYQSEFSKDLLSSSRNYFDYSAGIVARFNIKTGPNKILATNNIGASIHHITEPEMTLFVDSTGTKLPAKFNLHAYSVIKVNRSSFYNAYFLVAPGIIYENQALKETWFDSKYETSAKTLSFGFNAIIPSRMPFMSSLYTGAWMRKQYWKKESLSEVKSSLKNKTFDSFIVMLGFIKYNKSGNRLYRVAYSYDLTVSNASYRTGGSHEITLAIELHDLALPGRSKNWGYVKNPGDRFYHMK